MSDFTLARERIEQIRDFNVIESEFENQADQTRLKTANKIIGFRITSPAMSKTTMQTYQSFFDSKYGGLTSFTFTSPFDDTEYNVRFVRGSFKIIYEKGTFTATFEFKVVY